MAGELGFLISFLLTEVGSREILFWGRAIASSRVVMENSSLQPMLLASML
jgi:hypothetical protein